MIKYPKFFQRILMGGKFNDVFKDQVKLFFFTLVIYKRHSYSFQVLRMSKKRKETSFLFNTLFLNGLEDELSTLVKRNQLNWTSLDTCDLFNVVSQLSKTIEEN